MTGPGGHRERRFIPCFQWIFAHRKANHKRWRTQLRQMYTLCPVGGVMPSRIFQKNITFQPFWNMKFFRFRKFFTIILLLAISLPASWAQGNRDFMRETGKINVVVGVILLIFLGIVLYLVRLERKLTRLEHQLNDDKNEWTN